MSKLKYLLYAILLFFPTYILALTYPNLHYSKSIIYDLTADDTLYELNASEKTSIASLTKILTVITALDYIDDLNTKITYTKEMQKLVNEDTSKAGLKVGDIVTYEDLLYASILPSGADATIMLALSLSPSLDDFVNLMNEKAISIGMNNSHFTNVIGLDDTNHYSTAQDILTLLKYALNNPLFQKIYTTKEYTLTNALKVTTTLNHYNSANLDLSSIIGSKTGYTNKAGLCISVLFTSHNHTILIITLNTPKTKEFYHLKDTLELINFINNNYNQQIIFTPDNLITSLKVLYNNTTYPIKPSNYIYAFLPNDYQRKDLTTEYIGQEQLSFKDRKNSKIGLINYYYQNKLIYTENVFLSQDIEIPYLKYLSILIIILISTLFLKLIQLKNLTKDEKRLS